MEKEAIQSELIVILKAGKETVAEVKNPVLWQKVLAAINSDSLEELNSFIPGKEQSDKNTDGISLEQDVMVVENFASFLKVDVNKLVGACDPIDQDPFIQIDDKTWSKWRNRTPVKGPAAMSPIGIVATILAIWFRQLKKGNVMFSHVKRVLNNLGVQYYNPARAIRNCDWLQLRDKNQIRLNPSEIDKAIDNVRTFINKENIKK